jgi:hypothetical protein
MPGSFFLRIIRLETPFRLFPQRGHRDLGRIVHPQGYVVVLAVEPSELGSEVRADPGEDAAQVVQDLFREDAAPRFGHKTKCTCIKNTQCLPCRMSLSAVMDR